MKGILLEVGFLLLRSNSYFPLKLNKFISIYQFFINKNNVMFIFLEEAIVYILFVATYHLLPLTFLTDLMKKGFLIFQYSMKPCVHVPVKFDEKYIS